MALTTNKPAELQFSDDAVSEVTVAASTKIYQGSAIEMDAGGDAIALANSSSVFFGVNAFAEVDNSAGADGDKRLTVVTKGVVRKVPVANATKASVGVKVYLTDDDIQSDLTTTSTSNTYVGRIVGYNDDATPTYDVAFFGEAWTQA